VSIAHPTKLRKEGIPEQRINHLNSTKMTYNNVVLPSLRELESNDFKVPISAPTQNPTSMTLEIRPCEESDFADFARIQIAAFCKSQIFQTHMHCVLIAYYSRRRRHNLPAYALPPAIRLHPKIHRQASQILPRGTRCNVSQSTSISSLDRIQKLMVPKGHRHRPQQQNDRRRKMAHQQDRTHRRANPVPTPSPRSR